VSPLAIIAALGVPPFTSFGLNHESLITRVVIFGPRLVHRELGNICPTPDRLTANGSGGLVPGFFSSGINKHALPIGELRQVWSALDDRCTSLTHMIQMSNAKLTVVWQTRDARHL